MMQHIFLLFFKFFLQKNDRSILDKYVGSHIWLRKAVSLCVIYFSTLIYCFGIFIIVDRALGAPGHGKYVVDGLNDRDKRMLKLAMAKLLNLELI